MRTERSARPYSEDAGANADKIHVPDGSGSTARGFGRAVLAGAAAAGIIVSAHAAPAAGSPDIANIAAYDTGRLTDDLTVVHELPAQVRSDLEEAIAVDTCATSVTADEVSAVYQQLWLTEERPIASVSSQEFLDHAGSLMEAVRRDRHELGNGIFPENYGELMADFTGSKNLPLSVYMEAAEQFLAERGIRGHFDWEPTRTGKPLDVVPLTPREIADNGYDIRRNILDTIGVIANMPPSILGDPQIKDMYFGDIDGAAGKMNFPDRRTSISLLYDGVDFPGLVAHEGAHNATVGLCSQITEGPGTGIERDRAYESLNRTYYYPDQEGVPVRARIQDESDYTVLQSGRNDGLVITRSENGKTSYGEDVADTLGAQLLNVEESGLPYREHETSERDLTIMQEKMALMAARLAKVHPEEGRYVLDLMRLSRFYEYTHDAMNEISTAGGEYSAVPFELRPEQAENPYTALGMMVSATGNKVYGVLDPARDQYYRALNARQESRPPSGPSVLSQTVAGP